jgi:ABC-type bacteriocin/lantibiotic exporter with double-glycine peptidase domain
VVVIPTSVFMAVMVAVVMVMMMVVMVMMVVIMMVVMIVMMTTVMISTRQDHIHRHSNRQYCSQDNHNSCNYCIIS